MCQLLFWPLQTEEVVAETTPPFQGLASLLVKSAKEPGASDRQTAKILVPALGLTGCLISGEIFPPTSGTSVSSSVKWVDWAIGSLISFPALAVHEYWYT